jgi:UDP-N-acetylmuramate dehydrogenase
MENNLLIKDIFPSVKESCELKDYTTFRIGGPADYLFETGDSTEMLKIIDYCKCNDIPFGVIGGGSNILASDDGYRGVVIVYKSVFGKFSPVKSDDGETSIDASVPLGEAVMKISSLGLSGLEWASGIPGTVGGAINGNAGAFGGCISDNLKRVDAFSLKEGRMLSLYKDDCHFSYRRSIFKDSQDYLILKGVFSFSESDRGEIMRTIKGNIEKRMAKQPKGFSAGSVFKNYEGTVDKKLFRKYPELEAFSNNQFIPAGYLIDKCGLKGMMMGDAQIDKGNGNFIVNLGSAKADNVMKLIKIIKGEVLSRFGIVLTEEIKFLGIKEESA